jgi:muramidase (phage lysozyme)
MRDPISKITRVKKAEGMVQAEEHLPSKCKALSSNPNTTKKTCATRYDTFQYKWKRFKLRLSQIL